MKFGAKRTLALFLGPILPIIVGAVFFLLFGQLLFFFLGMGVGVLLSIIFNHLLIRHPFIDAFLGKGNVCFYVTETGFWIPFIVRAEEGFIRGKVLGRMVEGVMDSSLLNYFQSPKKATVSYGADQSMELKLKMNPQEYANARFAMEQMPFFIYSAKLQQFITKEMVSELNNRTFSKHMITYLSAKVRELTLVLRDFSRSYVDLHKPNQAIWEKPWFVPVVIIIILAIAGYFLLPHILKFANVAGDSLGKGLTAPATVLRK